MAFKKTNYGTHLWGWKGEGCREKTLNLVPVCVLHELKHRENQLFAAVEKHRAAIFRVANSS